MGRINGLLGLVDSYKAVPEIENDAVRGDVARAVVVFLQATFEDLLRTAARQRNCSNIFIPNLVG
jgi:hypothetical protein